MPREGWRVLGLGFHTHNEKSCPRDPWVKSFRHIYTLSNDACEAHGHKLNMSTKYVKETLE